MSAAHPILSRLQAGRPLLVGSDPAASLRARSVELQGPASLGRLLREHPGVVREHYHQEILAGVDVLACLTVDTLPRALQQIGMPFRAAALTGSAVELALEAADAAPRPVIVAGVLGHPDLPPVPDDRLAEELGLHATRLATAGCELLLARGPWRGAVGIAALTTLPTWAVASIDGAGDADGAPDAVATAAFASGAQLVFLEIPSAEVGLGHLPRLAAVASATAGASRYIGFALEAAALAPEPWADEAMRLVDAGVRVIGGGRGATNRHLAALSMRIRGGERQSLWPRAV